MRPRSGLVLTAILLVAALAVAQDTPLHDPHGDPASGVVVHQRELGARGRCEQCHSEHGTSWSAGPYPFGLFTENDNRLAFWTEGLAPCHAERPQNYPLDESDRLPSIDANAGYFEANVGGTRRVGVQYRGRWPGELIYTDGGMTPTGHFISPHANDADMPRRGPSGDGLCYSCHSPHPTPNPLDLLIAPYRGIGGFAAVGPPEEYALCFSCHGPDGPTGMDYENRLIADYYDAGLNGGTAGHQIRKNPDIAMSWPPHIQIGDMLPCYDCHNPHGSQGNDGVRPNGFLISDQRDGWSGLTDTLDDPEQNRRFCLGCHIIADGIPGSQTVEGIVMNTLPDMGPHRSTSTNACYNCHGRDYSGPTGYNVHHPASEPGPGVDIGF